VTNKVVLGAVRIKKGLQKELLLGNLESTRDWGHAKDYVRAMHRMLQLDSPNDFVVSTGVSKSVRELCEYVFKSLGMDYNDHVKVDSRYLRPLELSHLKGDSKKFREAAPDFHFEYDFESMLDEMISYWMERVDEQHSIPACQGNNQL
jgi:GDPmannose 4,6-dehydratase